MKKIQLCLGIMIVLSLFYFNLKDVPAGDTKAYIYNVDVTTSGILGRGILQNRKYYLVVNASTWTFVYQSTSSNINAGNYTNIGCIPVKYDLGFWEDAYYVVNSSWYYCTAEGTARIRITEKE